MDNTTKGLLLVCIGLIMYRYYKKFKNYNAKQAKLTWPRKISECPDYWVKMRSGKCKNMFDLGKCPTAPGGGLKSQGEINFNTTHYKGKTGNSNKCRWAHRCNNSWEGIDKLCA